MRLLPEKNEDCYIKPQRSQRVMKSGFNFAFLASSLRSLRFLCSYSTCLVITLLWLRSYNGYSQVIYCETPAQPDLTLVTIQSENGKTELNWKLSQSSNVASYIIYIYQDENGTPRGNVVDTVWNSSATKYIYDNPSNKYFSSSYVVAAYRLPEVLGVSREKGCTSAFSNILNSIFVKADLDTCNNKIIVSWNSYPSTPKKVTDYSVLVSVDGGGYTETAKVNPDLNSFTLNDFITDADYCFVIRANLEGGSFSTSNKACLFTRMQRPPEWINADFASVNSEGQISLSFSHDRASEITNFSLERMTGSTGGFKEISQLVSVNGSIDFVDDKADIKARNFYRLSAVNNCNNHVKVSNLCSNMILSLERNKNDLNLSWNSYSHWLGTISSYRLLVNTGSGFEEKAIIQPDDTLFTLGYKEIMYEVSGSEVCFYISALETSNPYGVNGSSNSSRICTAPTEIITAPNVFTPNSGSVNSQFKPVLSFTPVDYLLIINDRQGKVLFESRDYSKSWDGYLNGNLQPQGVYLWFLKVTTPSGKAVSRTGTITIINSR